MTVRQSVDSVWLLATAIMTVLIVLNLHNCSTELKTVSAIATLIPMYIVDEAEFLLQPGS